MNTLAEEDDNSDSGISPNDSDTEVLIYTRTFIAFNVFRSMTPFHYVSLENRPRTPKTWTTPNASTSAEEEKWYIIGSQVFLPFMIAGFGMVAAGLLLEHVKVISLSLIISDYFLCLTKGSKVFKEITEIYILVPALLGLKGNLEMTLASRLSTQVC